MYLAKTGIKLTATVLSVAILSACGSGGGSQNPTPPQNNPTTSSVDTIVSSSSEAASVSSVDAISSTAASSVSSDEASSSIGTSSSIVTSSSSSMDMMPPASLSSMSSASSDAPLSSSSVGVSSSEMSSSVESSSSVGESSSSEAGIAQCQESVDAGAIAYAANCASCHEPDGASFAFGQMIDVANAPYGRTAPNNVENDLATYIEDNMAGFVGEGVCKAEFGDCSADIAAYLQHSVDVAYCAGDVTSSSADMTSSSEAVSSSEASSSSQDVAVSSSSEASSSDIVTPSSSVMSSSSEVSSSSAMMMSSSSEVVSSSSEISSSSVAESSSSTMSSSSEAALPSLVEFVYPTFKANLGGVESTQVMVKTLSPATSVEVGGVGLVKQGDIWVSAGGALALSQDADQSFAVMVDGEEGAPLILNNHASGNAGEGDLFNATGLGFDEDDNVLYFTDAYMAQLRKFNPATGGRDLVYSAMRPEDASSSLYWTMAVDSANDEIYVLADMYGYDATVGSERYEVAMHVVDGNTGEAEIFADVDDRVTSARSVVLDLGGEVGTSSGNQVAYFMDFEAEQRALGRWYITHTGSFTGKPFAVSVGGETFAGSFGPQALTLINGELYIVREFASDSLTGAGSVLKVSTEETPDGLTTDSTVVASLANNGLEVKKPTAVIPVSDSELYIADQDRIWKLNLETNEIVLVSSSNLATGKMGSGPRLGTSITAMAMHPAYNMLYVAAGAQGIIAIDLATGNRITVAR